MKLFKYISFIALFTHLTVFANTELTLAEKFEFESKILNQKRTIVVSLPEGYEQNKAKYPVIYLLDGLQNIRHVVGSLDVLSRSGDTPPPIVVGIKSQGRMKDFTPTKVKEVPMSGGAESFLNFLKKELIPYIDTQYRSNSFRVLEGHSMSALFTAYTFMQTPELFNAYIVMSPAFWWDKEILTKQVKTFLTEHNDLKKKLYFGIGVNDGYGMRQELKRFVDEIKNAENNKLSWLYKEFENEGHMSAPLLTSYYAFKHIFDDLKLPQAIISNYDDAKFLAHEAKIIKKYGAKARQSQEIYVPLAMGLMSQKKYQQAISVFQRNADAYQNNNFAPNYAWLADAYEKNNQLQKAHFYDKKAYNSSKKTGYGQEENYRIKIKEISTSLSIVK